MTTHGRLAHRSARGREGGESLVGGLLGGDVVGRRELVLLLGLGPAVEPLVGAERTGRDVEATALSVALALELGALGVVDVGRPAVLGLVGVGEVGVVGGGVRVQELKELLHGGHAGLKNRAERALAGLLVLLVILHHAVDSGAAHLGAPC